VPGEEGGGLWPHGELEEAGLWQAWRCERAGQKSSYGAGGELRRLSLSVWARHPNYQTAATSPLPCRCLTCAGRLLRWLLRRASAGLAGHARWRKVAQEHFNLTLSRLKGEGLARRASGVGLELAFAGALACDRLCGTPATEGAQAFRQGALF